jgi:hypothetical protein
MMNGTFVLTLLLAMLDHVGISWWGYCWCMQNWGTRRCRDEACGADYWRHYLPRLETYILGLQSANKRRASPRSCLVFYWNTTWLPRKAKRGLVQYQSRIPGTFVELRAMLLWFAMCCVLWIHGTTSFYKGASSLSNSLYRSCAIK